MASNRLHDEIIAFVAWLEPRPEEITARQEVVSRVSKVVSGRFRDAIVTVFGSVAHDLSFPDGCVSLPLSVQISTLACGLRCLFMTTKCYLTLVFVVTSILSRTPAMPTTRRRRSGRSTRSSRGSRVRGSSTRGRHML